MHEQFNECLWKEGNATQRALLIVQHLYTF